MTSRIDDNQTRFGGQLTLFAGAAFVLVQIGIAIIAWWTLGGLDTGDAAAAGVQHAMRVGKWLIAIMALLSLSGTLAIYLLYHHRVTSPLRSAVRIAEEIADGRLASHIDATRSGEARALVEALADMQEKLARLIGETRDVSWQVVASSEQLARGASGLSARTEHQASTLEQTASSTEEFASSIRQTAENTQQATKSARKAIEIAQQGREVVSETAERMNDIRASAKKITEITSIIDTIAFQTNILALNAAVEAARAGDQGRGFAVVASEVRALAQRSAASAKDIKRLIETTTECVEAGSALVSRADGVMAGMVQSSQSVLATISEIAVAASEQASGIEQINLAITQLERVTQQNGVQVEETAKTAEAMSRQAQSLSARVNGFRLDPTRIPDSHPNKRRSMELAQQQQEEDRAAGRLGNEAGIVLRLSA